MKLDKNRRQIVILVQGDLTIIESGARRRFREVFDFLSENFEDLIVYSFFEDNNRPWDKSAIKRFSKAFPKIQLVLDHKNRLSVILAKFKRALIVVLPHLSKFIIRIRCPFISPKLDNLRKNLNDPCFFVCTMESMFLANGLPASTVVVDTLDLQFMHYAAYRRFSVINWKVIVRMRSELSILVACDASIAISQSEATTLNVLLPEHKCFFIPTFKDENASLFLKKHHYNFDMLFVGTAYRLNVSGLLSFLQNNKEWLKPFRIAVVGKVSLHPEIVEISKEFPLVSLLGFVDDLELVYAHTKLAISPVDGTGLKIKIVEALRYGTPVAASKSSLLGLPSGYTDCIFPLSRMFIERLVTDDLALAAAEAAAAKYLSVFGAPERKNDLRDYLGSKLT